MLGEDTSCSHQPSVRKRPWAIRFLWPCIGGTNMPLLEERSVDIFVWQGSSTPWLHPSAYLFSFVLFDPTLLFFPLGEQKPINSHFLFILPLQSVQLFDAIPTMLFAFSKEISIYLLHGWVPISLSLSLLSELPFTFISCLSQGWPTEVQTALKM